MNKDAIYHVRPADNIKLAEMELNIERLYHKAATPGGRSMLEDVQSLIERIKADEKKIKQLEKMNGISWLGDEQKFHPGASRIPPDIKDDTEADMCLVTGCDRKAVWESPLGGLCAEHWGEEGNKGEKGELIPKHRTAATLYEDRSRWAIPVNCADGGFRQQAYWQGREDGAREMEKEIHGN